MDPLSLINFLKYILTLLGFPPSLLIKNFVSTWVRPLWSLIFFFYIQTFPSWVFPPARKLFLICVLLLFPLYMHRNSFSIMICAPNIQVLWYIIMGFHLSSRTNKIQQLVVPDIFTKYLFIKYYKNLIATYKSKFNCSKPSRAPKIHGPLWA